ncbi:uncharacterized protein EI90DRAFT_1019448 [Cantharellus anzutake]|uniref:uncharacterized protein n=1 Tax=Cantharellus anzutake TaxID=1750568 RepID=UPI0019051BFB|nr:uncharacterized protein EI90DRAFT_1019448 [Cantharellus anzutake]KAF8331409.1 hypothetical protein EI90DRAFT_1019448 [Cantharellus anzutake]
MEAKLSRLPREQPGYKAEFLDLDIREGTVASAAISKDGSHVALGFGDGGIEVVDIDQQHSIARFQCDSCSPPVWIEFISGRHRIATEDNEGNVFIFGHGSQPLKLGALPSGCYPSVTVAADDGSFIVRLPRYLDPDWYKSVSILYVSGKPSMRYLSSPRTIHTTVPAHHSHCLSLELSPGARYVVACDQNQAFIWSTASREFIISHHVWDFGVFVTGITPYRPYITSGSIEYPLDGIPHTLGSGTKFDSDKSWLESLSHRSLQLSQQPRLPLSSVNYGRHEELDTPKLKLLLDNTLKLILPFQYYPFEFDIKYLDRQEVWYGDRVIKAQHFVYFPRASKDGTRFLVQGRMRAPIVVDISQIV